MKSKKICDYSGYACKCDGYKRAQPKGSTMCVCGHAKSQHHEREKLTEQIPQRSKHENQSQN